MRLAQILVLMPLGFGPFFSFLDPLDPFVPSLYSPSPADSPDMQLKAALAPPWAAHAPKSLLLGFARTPISKTPPG